MYFRAWVVSGEGERQVMDLSWSHSLSGQEVIWDYGHNEYGFPGSWYGCPDESEVFEIMGDQLLRITMHATATSRTLGRPSSYTVRRISGAPEQGARMTPIRPALMTMDASPFHKLTTWVS
jgi:hypothetical protein